ncbi:MAG: serine hydroxymethyltransferase [Bdellovibrionaceae bacterium]|nr:serine hydroxymethyltransferase [Pseudobdellovibrionaceae bacterium]
MKDLITTDPQLASIIASEQKRQESGLEMIASENYCSPSVMQAQGSILTNKYAEGYPSKRYYGGCEWVDQSETLAINRAKELFKAEAVNVQAHSGSQANMAAYLSLLNPGDAILGMDLSHGGHLTHGSKVNFSGKLFSFSSYGLDEDTQLLNYNKIEDLAKKHKVKLIVAGYSAYPRKIDFQAFAQIAKTTGSLLMVDMAHFAGLVATGLHQSPIDYADVITSTTHKTLRGPRGGLILCKQQWAKKINSAIFPGIQGGPLEHVIAAKAVAFKEALQPNFTTYMKQVLKNANVLAEVLKERNFSIVTNGTDNHLVLIDLSKHSSGLTGKDAEELLGQAHITVNKNTVPNETRSPFVTSGLRIGSPALTTRGMKEPEMKIIANYIADLIENAKKEKTIQNIKGQVEELCKGFPLFKY